MKNNIRKFKSRRNIFISFLVFGWLGLSVSLACDVLAFGIEHYSFSAKEIVLLLGTLLLMWFYYGTEYNLTPKELVYKSGPFCGNIKIQNINEIEIGKTLWAGVKPAMDLNGLIIKYNKYEEIYISPKTNDLFVKSILELNPNIKIKITDNSINTL